MLFIQLLRKLFVSCIMLQFEGSDAAMDKHVLGNQENSDASEDEAFKDLNEELQNANEELGAIENDSGLVTKYCDILGNFLEKVKTGEYPGLSEEDEDFQRLLEMYKARFEELKGLRDRGHEIEHVIAMQMHSLDHVIDKAVAGENIDQEIEAAYDFSLKELVKENELSYEAYYTQQEISELSEKLSNNISDIRKQLFSQIVSESDTGQSLTQLQDHPNIQKIVKIQEEEGFSCDILGALEGLEQILQKKYSSDIHKRGQEITNALYDVEQVSKKLNIIARDIQDMDGKMLGILRYNSTHEGYNEILKDKELAEKLSSAGKVPNFEELDASHIKIMREQGVDLRKIFLVTTDGKTFSGESLQEGEKYIFTFGGNQKLSKQFDISLIDASSQVIKIDGEEGTFSEKGIQGPGYYNSFNGKLELGDGSLIEIITVRNTSDQARESELSEVINQYADKLAQLSIEDQMTVRSMYQNAENPIDTSILPKGLIGAFLALVLNFGNGRNFKYNSETGYWEERPEGSDVGTPLTYGEYLKQRSGGITLGSLSAEYESGNHGPTAYNPNDNGAGPSYGTYQMNTDKGVYKSFIKEHGIRPGYEGWMAAINQYGTEKFQQMEHDWIKQMNYDPMMSNITLPGKENFSLGIQNVIWSTAVQHGPGRQSILDAINTSGVTPGDFASEQKLIHIIYDARLDSFRAGASRYHEERQLALRDLATIFASENSIYDQGIGEIPGGIQSYDFEKNPKTRVTLCSKTARLNLTHKLGVAMVPQGGSARESFNTYPSDRIQDFPPKVETDAKVADFYLEATPGENAKYGHRAAAFKQDGEWFVLDPYYRMGRSKSQRNNPIPAEQYISYMQNQQGRKLWGAAYFK